MTDLRRITRALLSVSDKTGLIDFARALAGHGIELVSTGGTAKAIADAGLKVRDVSDLTGFPEMMDGRVKTLHPKVHGGLLAIRDDAAHAASMTEHGIAPIDLLVVNLYPFEATVAKGAAYDDCIENIDIGGPAMIRAAAKNHNDVAVVVDADDYARVLDELAAHGGATTLELAQVAGAEGLCAHRRLRRGDLQLVRRTSSARPRPPIARSAASSSQALRYGENPHQSAAFYRAPRAALRRRDRAAGAGQAALLQQHQRHRRGLRVRRGVRSEARAGLRDRQARQPVRRRRRREPRRGLPQGARLRLRPRRSAASWRSTARSMREAARAITEIFTEVIIAPDATEEAIAIVGAKKNLRLLLAGGLPDPQRARA